MHQRIKNSFSFLSVVHGHLDAAHRRIVRKILFFFALGVLAVKKSQRGGGFRRRYEETNETRALARTSYLVKRIMPFPGGRRVLLRTNEYQ